MNVAGPHRQPGRRRHRRVAAASAAPRRGAFAAPRRPRSALLARGHDRPRGPRPEVARRRRHARSSCRVDVADAEAGRGGRRDRIEARARPYRRLGERRVHVRLLAVLQDQPRAEYKRVTEVTYHGYVYATWAALKRMLPRHHRKHLQVGSALAYRGIPLQTAYCGAKHASRASTRRCGASCCTRRATCTSRWFRCRRSTPHSSRCCPGCRIRPQPVPPIYQPEVAAGAVVLRRRPPSRREYWVGGSTGGTLGGKRARARPWIATWPARASNPTDGRAEHPNRRRTSSSPPTTEKAATTAPAARSTSGRLDPSPQLWASQHHGLLGALGGAPWWPRAWPPGSPPGGRGDGPPRCFGIALTAPVVLVAGGGRHTASVGLVAPQRTAALEAGHPTGASVGHSRGAGKMLSRARHLTLG